MRNRLTESVTACYVNKMSVSKLDTPGRFIPLLIVLLFIGSVMPLGGLSNSSKNTLEDSANIFKASSSNESYDLFIGAATSESGGDGSISTMEPDGSSQEESILSTLEFYTNEMISDIQIYGEGSTPAIEISVYLKFEGNDGASADINFVLKSGSSVVESEQITLEDPCTSSNPFGGNSCSYSVNIINIEIPSSGFTVENGKRLGLEVDASIDGCQGSGIGGGDGDQGENSAQAAMQKAAADAMTNYAAGEVRKVVE